ncbi:MAG: hypothetical protein OXG67_12580 [bacterium]|nr:hypothetical protein [bacterium]
MADASARLVVLNSSRNRSPPRTPDGVKAQSAGTVNEPSAFAVGLAVSIVVVSAAAATTNVPDRPYRRRRFVLGWRTALGWATRSGPWAEPDTTSADAICGRAEPSSWPARAVQSWPVPVQMPLAMNVSSSTSATAAPDSSRAARLSHDPSQKSALPSAAFAPPSQ